MFLQISLDNTATDAAAASVATATELPAKKTMTVLELAFSGGVAGNTIMVLLLLLSVITVYLFVERLLAIKKADKLDPQFMNNIRDHVANGKIQSAIQLCERTDTPVSRMIQKGITRIGKPLQDISASIENQGKLEIQRLETNLALLATMAGGAPMMGFLGTVVGMILSFQKMAEAGGQVQVDMLAEGIYVAMITTVAGLVVGIFAYFGYNYLVGRVGSVIHKMEASTTDFLDLLDEPA
jgi:biopolymer transport protein ExbB